MKRPVKVIPDSTYPGMYRVEWEDGVLSQDFYNYTRAISHTKEPKND